MLAAFSDSATVGTTLMPRLRSASTTVLSPAPACRAIAVAPVTWYHNGEPSAHRSAFCVTEVSALGIDQYGSQPLTIRRGRPLLPAALFVHGSAELGGDGLAGLSSDAVDVVGRGR